MTYVNFKKPTTFSTRKFVGICLVLLLSGVFFSVNATTDKKSAYAASDGYILSGPKVSAAQMAGYYRYMQAKYFPNRPFRATVSLDELAQLFIDEGIAHGVRGDIAWVQSIKETLWFNFPDNGQVNWTQNNFAGLGAFNSCNAHNCGGHYADARTGVRAQMQFLRRLADASAPASQLPYASPISQNVGQAPTWVGLNGRWAVPGTGYGESILEMYGQMAIYSGVKPSCSPDAQLKTEQTSGSGYWTVAPDGSVYSFGAAQHHGGMNGTKLNGSILGMAATVSGRGYWMVGSDGGIFSFGDAQFFGSTGGMKLNSPILGMAPTPSGRGYWLVAGDGGIFSFGDAQFYGSTGGMKLNKPVVGMASTPSGRGYWMVASDGGVFSFGDAQFFGSTGGMKLNQPIIGMATRPQGDGYWMVASDGGVFAFGRAPFTGSLGDCVGRRATMIQPSPSGGGYLVLTADGRVMSTGDAKHFGYKSGNMISLAAIR